MLSLLIAAAVVLSTLGIACVTLKIRDALNRGEPRPDAYYLRSAMLSPEERTLQAALLTLDLEDMNVAPKVQVSAVIGVKSRIPWAERQRDQARIERSHFDFLLIRRTDGHPLLALELDRRAADEEDLPESDAFIGTVCAATGLPVLHLPVRSGYDLRTLQRQIDAGLARSRRQEPVHA
jgi:hypothetical protein